MLTDRDVTAISTWNRTEAPDPGTSRHLGHPYRCTACDWTGCGATALDHFRATGHAIRGRDWPATWPDCQFTPYATYAHEQDDFHGGTMSMYTVHGGNYDRSTLSAETLRGLGIRVSER